MIFGQAELHNVEELVPVEGRPGLLLQRVPEAVRLGLLEKGQEQIRRASNIEIRFGAKESEDIPVILASYGGVSVAQLYYGDYWVEDVLIGEAPTTITLRSREPMFQFADPWCEKVPRSSFGPIWRIVIQGYEVHLIDIPDGMITLPQKQELPARRYLAYGTSITFGISASTPDLSYVSQTASRLGLDPINLGMPGAAFCERAIAEYIAERKDWAIASLCLSVNMLNQGVSVEEFKDKARYMVQRIACAHPNKPLICIGLFPSFADLGWSWPDREVNATSSSYREALRGIVQNCGYARVYYVDGRDLLDSWQGLSHDLLHPGNSGMIRIGERLASFMRPLLDVETLRR